MFDARSFIATVLGDILPKAKALSDAWLAYVYRFCLGLLAFNSFAASGQMWTKIPKYIMVVPHALLGLSEVVFLWAGPSYHPS